MALAVQKYFEYKIEQNYSTSNLAISQQLATSGIPEDSRSRPSLLPNHHALQLRMPKELYPESKPDWTFTGNFSLHNELYYFMEEE